MNGSSIVIKSAEKGGQVVNEDRLYYKITMTGLLMAPDSTMRREVSMQ